MQNENPLNDMFLEEEPINYREKFEKYRYHWKWFLLAVLLALVGAYTYLQYTPNQYAVATTILIDDENTGGISSELSAFEDLGLLGGKKKSIENEIGLLKSRSLMERVVKELGINIPYYKKGRVGEIELYKNDIPFKINFFSKDSLFYNRDTAFTIQAISSTHFTLKDIEGNNSKEHVFGENIATNFGDITITPKAINAINTDDEIIVQIAPLKSVAGGLRNNLQVALLYQNSSLIELSLKLPIKLKAQEILNDLVRQYNKDAVEDKSMVGNNTNIFINERLAVIEKDLSNIDRGVEEFKTSNNLTDISSEATLVLQSNAQLEKKIVDLNTQLKLAAYVSDYVTNNTEKLIPANLGLSDGAINSNSEKYNELLLERNRILKSSSEKHPVILTLNDQLNQLQGSISQGLVNLKSSLRIALKVAVNEEYKVNSKITAVPKQERQFRNIQRQQQIIETLYLYLLQKREENAISLAVTVPNAKVIDTANGSNIPISPKRKIVYLGAALLGLLIPFLVLYLIFLLDNKIHTNKDVEAIVKAPIIGEIPHSKSENKIVVNETDKDNIAESFRMLRTNIYFMLSGVKEGGKTIFVTSTIGSEGKTFISLNLAIALALSNKKVLLIGADVRKPKFNKYLDVDFGRGLTHFLMDDTLKMKDIVKHYPTGNFDVLSSGAVPPNPSELLINGRFEEVMAYGKANYDYVIVDTAPIKIVTDTLQLSEHADLSLYVIRVDFLDKRFLEIPEKMYNEKRLPNMVVLMNDINLEKGYGYGYGYGHGYGYGYDENSAKKPWWKRVFNA
jgi:tyrosine-protein kinase Etk/Wzc